MSDRVLAPARTPRVPWWARIAAKMVLARLPVGYGAWRRLNLFRHGAMLDEGYASDVFHSHLAAYRAHGGAEPPASVLELGPGDSVLSALCARLAGVTRVTLVDAGDWATRDVALYRTAAERLAARQGPGTSPPPASHHVSLDAPTNGAAWHPERWARFEDVLADCGATYHTDGLASLRALPAGSVDLAWSHAVLEHVRHGEFEDTMRELHRVLRPGGVASHRVDLQDHLGGGLASLRFAHGTWEGKLLSGSGFYTNRLRAVDIVAACQRAGFRVVVADRDRWPELPIRREALAPAFRDYADDELRVLGLSLVMVKP